MAELHADMTVRDILRANPKAKEILFEHGVLIDNDGQRAHESLGEVCASHHLSEKAVAEVVKELNILD